MFFIWQINGAVLLPLEYVSLPFAYGLSFVKNQALFITHNCDAFAL